MRTATGCAPVVASSQLVVPIPHGANEIEAATLPMNGLTAHMPPDLQELPANSTVAITGAAGAVGGYANQLAKVDGLHAVADAAPHDQQLVTQLEAGYMVAVRSDTSAQPGDAVSSTGTMPVHAAIEPFEDVLSFVMPHHPRLA